MPVAFRVPVVATAIALTLAAATPAFPASPQPRQNIQPSPDYLSVCVEQGAMSTACISATVHAIDDARATERMRKQSMVLPENYRSLSPAEQTFVVIDLERVDRGLRPMTGMVAHLNRDARGAAAAGVDPQLSDPEMRRMQLRVYRSVYARSYGVLAADYEWLYDDGYSTQPGDTSNVSCTSPHAQGCWGHRKSILDRFARVQRLVGGMGYAVGPRSAWLITAILAGGRGPAAHYTYTWRDALAHGADGG